MKPAMIIWATKWPTPCARACPRTAKTQATNLGVRLGAQLLGLGTWAMRGGQPGRSAAHAQFSRSDERPMPIWWLELAARAGYQPVRP